MEIYSYKAKDAEGKSYSGLLQANDEVDLQAKLKADNKFLVSCKKENNKFNAKKLKANVVSDFCRSIGQLLQAGVTLVRALKITADDESNTDKQRELYSELLKQVKTGMAFSDALELMGDAFPPLMINMIRSAESSGSLDKVCMQMAFYYDKDYRLNQKVKSAMTYPKILCVLIVAVVAVIMGFVIPQFSSLFDMMESLPLPTTVLLAVSNFVKNKWYVIFFVCVIAFMVIKFLFAFKQVRYLKDKLEVKLPKIGKLRRIVYTARFSRTLASLYTAGIPISTCIVIARSTIGNSYIEKQFDQLIATVRNGGTLSEAIDSVDGFTKKLSSAVKVGEETGAMDNMLNSIADQMEYDSEIAINKMVAMLEPLMIVIMAVTVGFIMVAVIQPIYGSYESIAANSGK